jgi:putative MATE family efflux protein
LIRDLIGDRKFFKTMSKIAVPIIVQNLILSSLNLIDVAMIGGLGDTAIASVGLANQYFFLLNLLLFGISSGSAIFTAQYWGNRDTKSIRKVLGIGLICGIIASSLFTIGGLLFPEQILGLFSPDAAVVDLGSKYLRVVAFSYIVTAITFSYSLVLRSTGNVKVPMIVSMVALSTNTVLNYILINGKLGAPAMGVEGAALATVIARVIEMVFLLYMVYRQKMVVAASVKEMLAFDRKYLAEFFKVIIPVILNESIWALGVTIYSVVYARMGTSAVASTNIAGTIERITWVIFMGLGNACAIMIGNKIGQGDSKIVVDYAKRFLSIGGILAIIMGFFVALTAPLALRLINASPEVTEYARLNLIVFSCILWARVLNFTIIIGILRSGGDTFFSLFIDVGGVWFVGIPMALLGAFVFKLPIYWVYAMVALEEIFKLVFGIPRVLSKKWINNLTVEPQ